MDRPPISTLFEPEPPQWGFRGDPHLWRDMAGRLSTVPCPATEDELQVIIERVYEQLTGHPLSHTGYIRLDQYDHGGMSGGLIAPLWWRDKAIPLLRQRLMELDADEAAGAPLPDHP
jgi:hypothetical protein